jgi:hypothetical protein
MKNLLSLFLFLLFNMQIGAADNSTSDDSEGWQKIGDIEDDWVAILTVDDVKKKVLKRNPELIFQSGIENKDGIELVFFQGKDKLELIFFLYNKQIRKITQEQKLDWLSP